MYDADCLEKIGANVKFLRTMRKLRQQDVAQTLGISQTHLSNMELRPRQVQPETAAAPGQPF